MQMSLPLAMVLLAGAFPVHAQVTGVPDLPPEAPVELIVDGLIVDFEDYHRRCRGGSGDEPETWAACGARDYAGYVLGRLGWCLGASGDPLDWMPCAEGGSRLERPPT